MIKLWLITFAIKYVFILQLSKLGHQVESEVYKYEFRQITCLKDFSL